mgnify:CR=1 FL=1
MLKHPHTLQGVCHLRVKLDTIKVFFRTTHAGNGAGARRRHKLETSWQGNHFIAMTHPDIEQCAPVMIHMVSHTLEQATVAVGLDLGIAKFLNGGAFHGATELGSHGLHAITDTQNRDTQLENQLGSPGRFSGGNRLRPPRQDDAFGIEGNDLRVIHIPGADFRVDPDFAYTAGDQLRILGAEIQYQDFVRMNICHSQLPI